MRKKKREGVAESSRQVSVRELRECAWKMDLGVACCKRMRREGACEGCV